jgi:hypothetical protein
MSAIIVTVTEIVLVMSVAVIVLQIHIEKDYYAKKIAI